MLELARRSCWKVLGSFPWAGKLLENSRIAYKVLAAYTSAGCL